MGGIPSKQKVFSNQSNHGQIFISTTKSSYFPGDTVSGKIYLHTFQACSPCELSLKFHGIEARYLVQTSETGRSLKSKKSTIADSNWSLHKWDAGLSAGHYEVPFSFNVPYELPASFHQEGKTFLAHVSYKLEAVLQSDKSVAISQTISGQQRFVVREHIERNSESYSKEKQFPLKTWGILSQGSLTVKAHFKKNILVEGEQARATLEIDNMVSKLNNTEITFQLVQVIRLKDRIMPDRVYKFPIAKETVNGAMSHNSIKIEDLALTVPAFQGDDHNFNQRGSFWPQGTDNQFMGSLSSATQGKYISSKFVLEISCKMEGAFSTVPKIKCPVNIYLPSPQLQTVKLPDGWNPKVLDRVDIGADSLEFISLNVDNDDTTDQSKLEAEKAYAVARKRPYMTPLPYGGLPFFQ